MSLLRQSRIRLPYSRLLQFVLVLVLVLIIVLGDIEERIEIVKLAAVRS